MTFKEFAKIAYGAIKAPQYTFMNLDLSNRPKYGVFGVKSRVGVKSADDITKETVVECDKVNTGGKAGGSCWDTDGHNYHSYNTGEVPDTEEIDLILEAVVPQLSFIQYKRIMRLVEVESWSEGDYYGNDDNYARKVLQMGKLYEAVKGMI